MSYRLRSLSHVLPSVVGWLLLLPIRFYRRWISPALPASCRYYPSCAAYAEEALSLHGPFRGSWLSLCRLGRCHPWTAGGVDHVPGSASAAASSADAAAPQPSPSMGA